MNLFFSYFGGKTSLAKHYRPATSDDIVVEPFAGAAGYSTFYEPRRVYLFDLYPVVYETWKFLIEAANDPAVRQQFEELPVGPFYRWSNPIPTDLPLGAQYMMGFWETQSQTYPSRWQQSPKVDPEGNPRPKNRGGEWTETRKKLLLGQLDKIKDWKVFNLPYDAAPAILREDGVDMSKVIWHIDPPYQNGGTRYKKSSNMMDFDALGNWCKSLEGRSMVCERDPANWLEFETLLKTKNASNKAYHEVVWYGGKW